MLDGNNNEITEAVDNRHDALQIYTQPASQLLSMNKRSDVANKKTSWCISCGSYSVVTGTSYDDTFLPGQSFIKLSVTRGNSEADDLLLFKSTAVQTLTRVFIQIRVPCADQAITLTNVNFEGNVAGLDGGAIATPDNYKNVLLLLNNVNFLKNVAGGKGGAIRVSGSQTAVHISDSEFQENKANSGGAMSVESSAALQMFYTTGTS